MTTAVLNYLKVQKKIQTRVNSVEFPEINWKIVCFAGFFVCLVLLVFYVWQINYLTKDFYLINGYKEQISQISQENKNLQVSFATNSFLGQVLEKVQALNFQKVTSVKYIQIPDASVGYNYKK
ncbi:MAG: hypothetical protein ABSF55_02780 [Candidatus Staskawiczbacteria bacterium]|jgi:Tfp pilus assembly protein PilO